MNRLRYEQRCAYHGHPVRRKRIVGKPSKQKARQRKNRGRDAFFHSTNVGSIG